MSEFVPILEAAVHSLEVAPDAAAVETELPPKLRALEELAQGLMKLVPGPYINLTNFSPSLISVPIHANLPIPGRERALHLTWLHACSIPLSWALYPGLFSWHDPQAC